MAKILDRYINEEGFDRFQQFYSVPRDAYAHEAGIHLFQRNRYLERATSEEVRRPRHYTISFRENQILEKYFPTALKNSDHRWPEAVVARVEERILQEPEYESRVSVDLITRLREGQVLLGFLLTITGVLLLGWYLGRPSRL